MYGSLRGGFMDAVIIEGKEYRKVTLRGRTKYIARDGSAINPVRKNQKATYYYNENGYPCFGGNVPVHQYVAMAWVDGYFKGAEVNHKDFNRNNFNADNLEWLSHEDNVKYSIEHNYNTWCKCKQGEKNGRATITADEAREIRRMYDEGMKISDIVKHYHPEYCTRKDYRTIYTTYYNVCHRVTWKHLV